MAYPQDLRYSETHEWVKVVLLKDPKKKGKGRKIGIVGLTEYAVSRLSDLVHLELPRVGETVEQGNAFGEVESVKTVAELVAPVTGRVVEVNQEAVKNVDLVMEEPYEEGWLIKVKFSDESELESLMTAKEYEEYIQTSEEEGEKKDDEEEIDEGFFM